MDKDSHLSIGRVTLSYKDTPLKHVCRTRLHKKPCSNTLSGSRLLGMFKNINLNTSKEVLHSVWVAELHAIMQRICYS